MNDKIIENLRVITVNDDGNISHNSLIRIEKGVLLRIVAKQGTRACLLNLYTNYPDQSILQPFNRNVYRRLHSVNEGQCADCLNFDMYYEIECDLPGAYHFYFEKNSLGFNCYF
jgi:hypothetical protein